MVWPNSDRTCARPSPLMKLKVGPSTACFTTASLDKVKVEDQEIQAEDTAQGV